MYEWTALLGKRAMNGMQEIALPLGISIVREGQPPRVPSCSFTTNFLPREYNG